MASILKIHPDDNAIVALRDLKKDETVRLDGQEFTLQDDVAAKHKFAEHDLAPGDSVYMYGVLVGKAQSAIPKGGLLHVFNLKHATNSFAVGTRKTDWQKPDVSRWQGRTFRGYHRADGSVGTANYWVVVPMVFCENRNVEVLRDALVNTLGYSKRDPYLRKAEHLLSLIRQGTSGHDLAVATLPELGVETLASRVFPNVDGIKFLTHAGGCGGTRQDAQALCGLLAGYITHPNVAGATVLSLGCQNAQVSMLREEIEKRVPGFDRPLFILEQQALGTEEALMDEALRKTLAGLAAANELTRQPAPLSQLCLGLECGGSDGFSGISANPTLGYVSDVLVTLGAKVILSEFPELCGVEQELSDRCVDEATAQRFSELMTTYNARALAVGSGFDMNPSPGNIKDGLITDAIKSAGAAKKGGTSPVVDVLDYPEKATKPGLTLLCTPGNDVESTTAEVAAGANVVLFTTGLGTPTGNPIAPVLKVSSNTILSQKMPDIIDINTGTIIEGTQTIEQAGDAMLEHLIAVASGEVEALAVKNGQDDFIPWKRGVSL
ncbi:altronate dehydratase family protein [Rhabdobacter roseus]|uniref:Altronate hydrolase n=1 Tax=Rhabdobacter roseus TaxID=1655419 RepID=A0A840TKQ8_9BACT|nr:altronate dehydratase family protein [Rhabdobacter roseus]MBB5284091.1 altronate hydrolase [Rhabdobacter roseus]